YLDPTGSDKLFLPAGVVSFTSDYSLKMRFDPNDGTLEMIRPLRRPLRYTVDATFKLPPTHVGAIDQGAVDPFLADYARRPEVGGQADDGTPLWQLRGTDPQPHPLDAIIATNVERH